MSSAINEEHDFGVMISVNSITSGTAQFDVGLFILMYLGLTVLQ